jgi:MFS family permease
MWTVYIVALVQMVGVALSPAIEQMKTVVFSQYSLSAIQTALSLPGLIIPTVGLITAELMRRALVTKKAVVVAGLFTLGAAGLLSLVMHDRFWHVIFLCALMGVSAGCYLSTVLSIMMDRFTPDERRTVAGHQAVFVNMGGFLVGLAGGALASWKWYGGFLVALVGIPIGVMSLMTLPKENRKSRAAENKGKLRTHLGSEVFFLAAILTVFMMLFVVCNGNIAVHLTLAGFENTTLIGLVAAAQMAGGAALGLFFVRISSALKYALPAAAFFMLFISYTVLNVFHGSLVLQFIGVFFLGMSLSLIGPYCVIAVSHFVDTSTSAFATSLITGFAPGIGGFLSPVIITNLTRALAGDSTNYRYQFVAFLALGCGVAMAVITYVRRRKREKDAPDASAEA